MVRCADPLLPLPPAAGRKVLFPRWRLVTFSHFLIFLFFYYPD
jgi:hypothetical protein